MRRLFLITGALALAACSTTGGLDGPLATTGAAVADATLPPPPAPLAKTAIDDKALDTAWRSFDVALDTINLLMDSCELYDKLPYCAKLKPGSASAVGLANGIDKVLAALKAAEHAAAAGSATSYRTALAEANAAIADLKLIIGRAQ